MTSQGIVGKMKSQCAIQGFTWIVEHFFSLSGYYYESSTIRFWGRIWCLRLFPNIQSKEDAQGYVALYPLAMEEWNPPPSFEIKFSILMEDGETYDLPADISASDEIGRKISPTNAIRRCELFLEKEKFVPDDVLTIVATFKIDVPLTVEGSEKVVEDIGKLLRRGDDSDIVVRVGNVEFLAHRAILCVRCPALRTLIHDDPAKRNSVVLTITDYGPDVVDDLLHYIYTGTPRELTVERALVLYHMAHQYSVDDLKRQCSRCILDSLCVDTFCSTFCFALRFGDSELLNQSTDFFATNYRLIVLSNQWQSFKSNRPTEVSYLFNRAQIPLEDLD